MGMDKAEAEVLLGRFVDALNRHDFEAMMACVHEEYVQEFPQSRERVRGMPNVRALFEGYHGAGPAVSIDPAATRVMAPQDHWVITPTYTLVRVDGSGDTFTSVLRLRYPDDSWWYMVSVNEVRDGRIARRTSYFAPEYEVPEWHRPYVELLETP
jgi:ketosteroid isomerase-like protein